MVSPLLTDGQIRDVLLDIGKSDVISITTREAEFLESAVYKHVGEWTVEQRGRAAQIAEKYRHQL